MTTLRKHQTVLACFLLLISAGVSEAALVTPTNAWSNSYWSGNAPGNLIDSSGLSANSPTGTHDNNGNASTMWIAGNLAGGLGGTTGSPPSVTSQSVVFDLGTLSDLSGAHIWNQNQNHATAPAVGEFYEQRGTKGFDIYVSSDTDPLTATWTSIGSHTLAMAGGTATEPMQWVPFDAAGAKLVKFDMQSAHSGAANEYVGLSEVRFQSVNTGEFFSEDFEGTGIADGAFTSGGWGPQFTVVGDCNLLNPATTGGTAAWLNPVPAELGDIFAVLHSGSTATANLTDAFVDNTIYTLSFTQFKRDDLDGDAITARIIDANTGLILASEEFSAITTDDLFLTQTLSYTTSGGLELGHAIRLEFDDATGGNNLTQVGIDNISLAASSVASSVPEPSSFVLAVLSLMGLTWHVRRRRKT